MSLPTKVLYGVGSESKSPLSCSSLEWKGKGVEATLEVGTPLSLKAKW